MRVLHVTGHSDRPETEMFVGLYRLGVELKVCCAPGSRYRYRLIQAGIPVEEISIRGRMDRKAVARIRRLMSNGKFDLLHLFNNKAVSNGILAALGRAVKIIAYRGITGNVSFWNPASWMTYLHPRVDRVICVAEAVRRYFLQMRWMGLRLPPDKFVTIYKGHRLEWYREPPADLQPVGIPPEAFVVGCVANYRPRKGLEVLVEAAGLLAEQRQLHLLLVGHMSSERLQQTIRNSPLRDRIHMVGYRPDAPALTAACDAYVLPALRREGLPKGVIEAMAYGVAPIVSDSGGSPELVVNGESGLVVPSGSAFHLAGAISYLMEHPEARRDMGQRARERIDHRFRIEDTIQKTAELYRELLNSE
jgi:glycosyltransferase involved in cell wall biosynthesis